MAWHIAISRVQTKLPHFRDAGPAHDPSAGRPIGTRSLEPDAAVATRNEDQCEGCAGPPMVPGPSPAKATTADASTTTAATANGRWLCGARVLMTPAVGPMHDDSV